MYVKYLSYSESTVFHCNAITLVLYVRVNKACNVAVTKPTQERGLYLAYNDVEPLNYNKASSATLRAYSPFGFVLSKGT